MSEASMPAQPLDGEAVEMLAEDLLRVVRAHYERRPTSPATVQELLNGLGSVAAILIYGTGTLESQTEAYAFFVKAVDGQIADLAQQEIDPGLPPEMLS